MGNEKVQWVESELSRLRSENDRLKLVVPCGFAPRCTSDLYSIEPRLLGRLLKNLEKSGSICPTDKAVCEHSMVLATQSYRMASQRRSTRRRKTVQNTKTAVCRVGKTKDGVRRWGFGAASPRKSSF